MKLLLSFLPSSRRTKGTLSCLLCASIAGAALLSCKKEPPQKIHEPPKVEAKAQDVDPRQLLASGKIYNREALIPPQCYTKTDGVHNPCYVCHQDPADQQRPNVMRDGSLQGSYAFSEVGEKNNWKNLFKDRRSAIERISDEEIRAYVRQDNYAPLVKFLKSEKWQGAVFAIENLAEGAAAFDEHGLAKDGSRWVAFNYKPFPSTFWPTNGSTDDTMIRLSHEFSEKNGAFSRDLYYANLSLVEMAIRGVERVTTPALNEKEIGVDIDGSGTLDSAVEHMVRRPNYLGDASNVTLHHMLYPEGTEFLHTVRYIGVDDQGRIHPAPRMKEVRYMKKAAFSPKAVLASRYYGEMKEKHFENLPQALYKGDQGTSNSFGWMLVGFIENEKGELRKQQQEEEFFCVGCHKSIGSTIDQTFGFPRKVSGQAGWGYIDLADMTDVPSLGETEGEILTYLKRAHGGSEYRHNEEMFQRWFNKDGTVNESKVVAAKNVYELITPSVERALLLNKAYKVIVSEQSFIFGRDAVVLPTDNVLSEVDQDIAPLAREHRYKYDIRLDWGVDGEGSRTLPLVPQGPKKASAPARSGGIRTAGVASATAFQLPRRREQEF